MNEEIVDEIYTVLVERFNIGEVFLPKYGKSRLKDITWKQFITATLELDTAEYLYAFCGYATPKTFNEATHNKYPLILKDKDRRHWNNYLFSLVDKKRCSCCTSILSYEYFYTSIHRKDELTNVCKLCEKGRVKKYREENKEVIVERKKIYYEENKDSILKRVKQYYEDNKENIKESRVVYRVLNKDKIVERNRKYRTENKESITEGKKIHYLLNKPTYIANNAKRRATKLQATPNWANLIAIKEIYRTCPEGYHVDHIVPLQGKLVCGLHCEFNLQHLPASENLSKGNRFEV